MTGFALPHLRPPVDPLTDTARETLITWAQSLTAAAERRRAAIRALIDVSHMDTAAMEAVAEIKDPTGIHLRSEERNRAWAGPHSEIIEAT